MDKQPPPIEGLKRAMLERARTLAAEHVAQGKQSRRQILQAAREKIQLMEQKELLLAKSLSEREYQRKIQASEIQMQAALDRNRWGLVETLLHQVQQHLQQLQQERARYHPHFIAQFRHAAALIDDETLVAHINQPDHQHYGANWQDLCSEVTAKRVTLCEQPLASMGGIKLTSGNGDVMVDNSFEGLLSRQQGALQQVIFERLFATVDGTGALLHG
jgi:V/A-type H+-transporting ATPase subunit E